MINNDVLMFFNEKAECVDLYESLEKLVLNKEPELKVKVSKSQISFYNKHLFGCVSFRRVRKKKDLPPVYIVLTLGHGRKIENRRVEIATEPYPGRWTHHFVISSENELDRQLSQWIKEAADFSRNK